MSRTSALRPPKWRVTALALIGALAVLATACSTGPVYRERGPGETVGYRDTRLSENRYRVTFSGSTTTRREEVEDYLLMRSAEVTLDSGYTNFVFDTRDTRARTYYRSAFGPHPQLAFGFGFGRYYGPGPYYWSSYAFNDPFWPDINPVTRFEAYAEIVMLSPEEAAREPRALDAREVMDLLEEPPPPPPPPPPE